MKQSVEKSETNTLGQPIGLEVPDWMPRAKPDRTPMLGQFCRVEPLDPDRHLEGLWKGIQLDPDARNWTYSPPVKPATIEELRSMLLANAASPDPYFHAIIDLETGEAVGWATYMRMQPDVGVIEVGNIHYTPLLQRKLAGTEAMYLMMRRVFDELGYRRYEWKCHWLNAPSRAAAIRYGFLFEGIHRQALVMKGRNRDTAWYSILDSEWPAIRTAFETWLSAENFDEHGRQRQSLSDLTGAARQELAAADQSS